MMKFVRNYVIVVFILGFTRYLVIGNQTRDSHDVLGSTNSKHNGSGTFVSKLLHLLENSTVSNTLDSTDFNNILEIVLEESKMLYPNETKAVRTELLGGFLKAVLGDLGIHMEREELQRTLKVLMNTFGLLRPGASGPVNLTGDVTEVVRELVTVSRVFSAEYGTSPPCTRERRALGVAINNNEYWAMLFLDAMGKLDTGFYQGNTFILGNFDQCMALKGITSTNELIRGVYTRYKFYVVNTPRYAPLVYKAVPFQQSGLPFLYWYLCLPSSCNESDVSIIGTRVAGRLGLQLTSSTIVKKPDPSGDWTFVAAVAVLSVLACSCLVSTVVDFLIQRGPAILALVQGKTTPGFDRKKQFFNLDSLSVNDKQADVTATTKASSDYDVGVTIPTDSSQQDSGQKSGRLTRWFHNFSLYRNVPDLLRAKHCPGDITCLHGIRVFSITWVVLGHSITVAPEFGNIMSVAEMTKWWSFQGIYNSTFAVDTFFLLSGCLVCYLFLRMTDKAGGLKSVHLVVYYVHRYLRLTPLFGLIILIYVGITPYMEYGPFQGDASETTERDNCGQLWWWNLLYISNLRLDSKWCYGVHWYLPNDMQFYIVAPLILVPFALGYKVVGFIMALLQIACHIITTAILTPRYSNNLDDELAYVYFKPYSRCAPYAIGLLVGFLLYKTKCKAKLRWFVVLGGWFAAFALALLIVYLPYDGWKKGGIVAATWNKDSQYAYKSLKGPLWAVAVAWVVFACASGYGGIINSILSWQAWIPLSRLTFGTYLTHTMVHNVLNNNRTDLAYFSTVYLIERYLAVSVLSYAVSFVLSLLIEIPVRNLIRPLASIGKTNLRARDQSQDQDKGQTNPTFTADGPKMTEKETSEIS